MAPVAVCVSNLTITTNLIHLPQTSPTSRAAKSSVMSSSHSGSGLPTPTPLLSPFRPRPTLNPDPPTRTRFSFDDIEDAIAAFARGEFLVVMDDEGRENEGDLIVSAAGCSTEQMAWMIKHTRSVLILLHPIPTI
jgi:hypothetical protein